MRSDVFNKCSTTQQCVTRRGNVFINILNDDYIFNSLHGDITYIYYYFIIINVIKRVKMAKFKSIRTKISNFNPLETEKLISYNNMFMIHKLLSAFQRKTL